MAAAPPRWGYHQLADWYAAKLVRSAAVQPGELVVDLGAGTGAITQQLLSCGAEVVAVELHPARAAQLRQRVAGWPCLVLEADIAKWQPPHRRYRVVANPPFASLAALLRVLTGPGSRLESADLVVPLHVAARWARGAGYQRSRYGATMTGRLPATAFRPPATQPTAVLRLSRGRPLSR